MAWRAFASTCAVLHAWVVPIFGLFDPPENSFVMILFRFTWAMLIVDVLVCSCTAKVDRDGDMVSATLSECASSYLRDKRGYIDILALIPFDTRALQDLYSSAPGLLSELAHANRLLVLYRVARWVQHLNGEVVLNMHLMWIAQSLVIGFLGINWMAALWWTVGQMDSNARDGKPSWVEMAARNPQWRHVFEKNTDGTWKRSWEVRYGLACYWVINSALIPEHSHFSVPSFQERWIGKVFFALSQTFLVWVAGSFTSSLANQRANRAVFQRRADVMADFLETSHLSKQLQQRVTRYMNHVWQRTRGIDPFTLLDDLPSTVHAELAMKAYKHLLIKVPLFEGADMAFLRAVCLALRPILFMAGDYIIRKGDLGAEMYLVLHGDVEIVSVDESGRETVLSTMRSGAYFGEISLYLSRPRTVSVRAKTAVDILVLPKHHLDPILKMYPDVHARIMSIAQEHLLKDAVRRGSEQSATAQAADTRFNCTRARLGPASEPKRSAGARSGTEWQKTARVASNR
ncbi:cyclic nucleotide-binding-like protein [Catenaria anguillulae PL171]|uniref:Cyclic nucleotide-binding-like protein n=1 Tax=Catenaria anguillulae PL171 TaxID=765915 RepID=A0A1Y2I4N8_9FUNG|nr:cyclic nucleotide-binding-like protein [Catenaria anguillulae PL171]